MRTTVAGDNEHLWKVRRVGQGDSGVVDGRWRVEEVPTDVLEQRVNATDKRGRGTSGYRA